MSIIDISWPITQDMTTYKDEGGIRFTPIKKFVGDAVRETEITMSTHIGTHIDASSHFLKEGRTIDEIALERMCGECKVLDFTGERKLITAEDLKNTDIKEEDIVLFKTKNSFLGNTEVFIQEFVALDKFAAEYLASKKIKAVGIDYLGIERSQPEHETHITLLESNIVIIEGLRLRFVKEGKYTLYCLPLNVVGLDGAPARAILVD